MRFSAAKTAEGLLPGWLARLALPFAERIDAILTTSDDRAEAGRLSLLAFFIRIASAAIAFASQVLLARWMGSFEYGIFVLVWTTVIILGSLSCLGFQSSIIRFIPEYRETGRLAELRGLLLTSRVFVLLASSAIAAIGVAGVTLLSGFMENYYVIPFYLGLICLPMIAMSEVAEGTARAHNWGNLALMPIYILRPLLILVFMAGALIAGFEASAVTAIVATIVATLSTAFYQVLATTARAERILQPGPRQVHLGQWIVVSLPIFLVEGFFFLLTNADVLLVGYFMRPEDVAVYFATVKTLALVHFVYFAVKAGAAQRYAQYAHGGDHARLAAFARDTVSWTFWPSLMMGGIVLLLGQPMLMLFGEAFVAGYPLLFPLVAGVVIRAAVGPAESLLTMSGHQNVCAAIYGMTLACNVALTALLIPVLGLWGVALATALAICIEAALLAYFIWRRLGILMFILAPQPAPEEAA
ncbi:oligosaccharide flippase family protein [Chelativorans sp. ZYF759]|uniref:lipopolysaccharide biosynthesis protein n=1 Tax=Chelativorans sp. ZYF759 TaxID=2692213 RepID=UPI00145F0C4A|nr:oligosaccharide flippase family protein [Chelativorans sp. ZYF759]